MVCSKNDYFFIIKFYHFVIKKKKIKTVININRKIQKIKIILIFQLKNSAIITTKILIKLYKHKNKDKNSYTIINVTILEARSKKKEENKKI